MLTPTSASSRPGYGQQDSHWIAYYDVLRRLGLARYRSADDKQFEEWATLARSCGWWWPGEDRRRPLRPAPLCAYS